MADPLLFTPIRLREITLKNRVVIAPMHQYSAVKGFATDWHLMNAGRYAAGGAGLVIMESTKVERRGCGTVGDLGMRGTPHRLDPERVDSTRRPARAEARMRGGCASAPVGGWCRLTAHASRAPRRLPAARPAFNRGDRHRF